MPLEFMLAKEYSKNMKPPRNVTEYNPDSWWISEKLDGFRCRTNEETNELISRQNKKFNAPKFIIDALKLNEGCNILPVDGELFAGRENFQKMGVVRKKIPIDEEWYEIKYYVYDCLHESVKNKPFNERYGFLKKCITKLNESWVNYIKKYPKLTNVECPIVLCRHYKIKNKEYMENFYNSIIKKGGEGIMLKNPDSMYEGKRSNNLLKYKPVFDKEAKIIGYKLGSNKYEGMLGAFICKPLINKGNYHIIDNIKSHEFSTSGMDDSIRDSYEVTHPIGTIITYSSNGFTDSGKPRFARYIRIRDDLIIKNEDIISNDNILKIIKIFGEISSHKHANGETTKNIAYKRALQTLHKLSDDSELNDKLPGIGNSFKLKIDEIINTGTCKDYESIKNVNNPKIELMKIHGIGPKKAQELVDKGFTSIESLQNCKNLSEHLTFEQIMGVKYFKDLQIRIPKQEIIKHEIFLKRVLSKIDINDKDLTITGSYRRNCDNSGDIDILLKSNDISIFNKFIDKLKTYNYLIEDLGYGSKKYFGICKYGSNGIYRRIDIMYTPPQEYPFAILYFTGSSNFNKKMREHALELGYSMNEYSLKCTKNNTTLKNVQFNTEKDIFKFLNMKYVEPHLRL